MNNQKKYLALFISITILVGIFIAIQNQSPAIDHSVFTPERAIEHVKAIAQAPRPAGSEEIIKAREYLISQITALGIEL